MYSELIATIHLDKKNKDGVLYISSKDLPGLWVWGTDPEQVQNDVIPTITKMYQYNDGLKVEIKETCSKGVLNRWFGGGKVCDTFEVYSIANISKEMPHGRIAVER